LTNLQAARACKICGPVMEVTPKQIGFSRMASRSSFFQWGLANSSTILMRYPCRSRGVAGHNRLKGNSTRRCACHPLRGAGLNNTMSTLPQPRHFACIFMILLYFARFRQVRDRRPRTIREFPNGRVIYDKNCILQQRVPILIP